MSEHAGYIGWKERAEKAEAQVQALRERCERYGLAYLPGVSFCKKQGARIVHERIKALEEDVAAAAKARGGVLAKLSGLAFEALDFACAAMRTERPGDGLLDDDDLIQWRAIWLHRWGVADVRAARSASECAVPGCALGRRHAGRCVGPALVDPMRLPKEP